MKTSATLVLAAAAGAYAQSASSTGAIGPAGSATIATAPSATPAAGTPAVGTGGGLNSMNGTASTRTFYLTNSLGSTTGTSLSTSQAVSMTGGPGSAATSSTQPGAGASVGVVGQWILGAAGIAGWLAL